MMVRNGSVVDGDGTDERAPGGGPEMPNVRGDLEELMGHRPVFRVRLHGYDRLEVDNYAIWAEGELNAVRREADHLLRRFGECSAQLEVSRRLLADASRGRDAFPVSERVQEMLRLASEEAAARTETAAEEAERILAEARTEADARLGKAHRIKEAAVAAADELLEQARRDRAAAAAAVARAETEAAEILRQAAVERDRLAAEAAQERARADAAATAYLTTVQAKAEDLRRQQDQARRCLRGLADRLGEALAAVSDSGADRVPQDGTRTHVVQGNVAVEGAAPDQRDGSDVVVMTGRPAPVPH